MPQYAYPWEELSSALAMSPLALDFQQPGIETRLFRLRLPPETLVSLDSGGSYRSWRSLGTRGALVSSRALNPLWSGWSVFSWRASEARSSSFSPSAFGAMYITGYVAQSKSHFPLDDIAIDAVANISFVFESFHPTLVTYVKL